MDYISSKEGTDFCSDAEEEFQFREESDGEVARTPIASSTRASGKEAKNEYENQTGCEIYENSKKSVFTEGIEASYSRNVSKSVTSICVKLKGFHCSDCDCYFKRDYQLVQHASSIHGNEKPFKCTECDQCFSLRSGLKKHTRFVHNNENPFKCAECTVTYSLEKHLKRHVENIHRNKNPFKCIVCGWSFRQECDLRFHIDSVHENPPKMQFQCRECVKSFLTRRALTKHSHKHWKRGTLSN